MTPTATVGVVGAGQLARMLAPAAVPLGIRLDVLAATPDDSAAQVLPTVEVGTADLETLRMLASRCDVLTFDHELVDPGVLAALEAEGASLAPSPSALAMAQDKAHQRDTLSAAGLPVPAYALAESPEHARTAAERLGWPLVLKAPLGGYDGRGVAVAQDPSSFPATWERLGGGPVLLEEHVALEAELAVLVARGPRSGPVPYAVTETVQTAGILTELVVPARVPDHAAVEARRVAADVAELVAPEGVFAVELFWTGEQILVNEVACRPHNSGHWTIEGARTSQFANHLRGALGWPIGATDLVAPAVATVNLLGPADGSDPSARLARALEIPEAAIHLYGKAARPGRKLGHVTAAGETVDEALGCAREAAARLVDEPASPPSVPPGRSAGPSG